MKKLCTLLAIGIITLTTACKTSVKGDNSVSYSSAIAYNDSIVKKQQEIISSSLQLTSEADVSKAAKIVDESISKITVSIKYLQGMPDWKGNTTLRDRALDLFNFYKELFSKDYKAILEIKKDGQITSEEQAKLIQIQTSVTEKEAKLDTAFEKAQKDFAESNHMGIINNPIQEKIDALKK